MDNVPKYWLGPLEVLLCADPSFMYLGKEGWLLIGNMYFKQFFKLNQQPWLV